MCTYELVNVQPTIDRLLNKYRLNVNWESIGMFIEYQSKCGLTVLTGIPLCLSLVHDPCFAFSFSPLMTFINVGLFAGIKFNFVHVCLEMDFIKPEFCCRICMLCFQDMPPVRKTCKELAKKTARTEHYRWGRTLCKDSWTMPWPRYWTLQVSYGRMASQAVSSENHKEKGPVCGPYILRW